ncbi:MAG TPA: RES family NAD+ phosphorylase [Solirubrobacteraceae bacterium]|jgi:hypothetical protein
MALPPPAGGPIAGKFYTWAAMRPITRVCDAAHLPNSFNPSDQSARFRPIYCGAPTPIPTMYGSNRIDGALGETVFHDVPPPGGGTWTIPRASLYGKLRSVLIPMRDLRLFDLTGWAHKALMLDGRALVECGPAEYPITAQWAERFHDLPEAPDGLFWRSRQYDKAYALMLFEDRVAVDELHVVFDETVALWEGVGLDELSVAAEAATVTIALP